MFAFKLLDIVVQGFAFLTALILLMTFNVYGYFYWIKVGIIIWILLSVVFNIVVYRPLSTLRKMVSFSLLFLLLLFGTLYVFQTPVSQLNFYFKPLSFLIIFGYFAISLVELNILKKKGKIDLDF